MANVQNDPLIGQRFGYLTILAITQRASRITKVQTKVMAECRCGAIKEYFLGNLRRTNHTKSCGCHKIETAGDAVRTHGLSGRNALYNVWNGMKTRCYNETADEYIGYGSDGVEVCELWRTDFKAFYNWCMSNGWKPGLQIDKDIIPGRLKIPALLYSPEMCTITTSRVNNNNRKDNIIVEYKGESKTIGQLASEYSVKYHMLWTRIVKLKWDIERAIKTPPRKT